jgi:uncharacterized protein (TIGR00730 family)
MSPSKSVAVFGGSRVVEGSVGWNEAYQAGRALAQAGFVVWNGGYDGAMAAVSKGAFEAGGRVIGVVSDLFAHLTPNSWLTERRNTASLYDRLRVLTEEVDAYLALRGSIGTLSEITLAWTLIYTGNVAPRPLVLLGDEYRQLLDAMSRTTNMGERERSLVRLVNTIDEAVEALRLPPQWQATGLRG